MMVRSFDGYVGEGCRLYIEWYDDSVLPDGQIDPTLSDRIFNELVIVSEGTPDRQPP